ncbi:DUF5357 family protein [Phormidesmis sp. 146-12]
MSLFSMREVFKQVRDRMNPPQAACWQTFILLSVFSVVVAGLTSSPVQNVIASLGWVFLIAGVWWFTYDPAVKKKLTVNTLFLGPWITGALVSIWLFGSLQGRPTAASYISWPVISSIIWSIRRFIKTDPVTITPTYTAPAPAARQEIVLVLLSNLIISCWFQFYFLMQDWLNNYPSLRADDFSRSAFVFEVQPQNNMGSRGIEVLDTAEKVLKLRLEGKPWPEVERWLKDLDQEMPAFSADVQQQLPRVTENDLWDIRGRVTSDQYTLELQAVWGGPTARSGGYSVTKSCQITQSRKIGPPAQFDFRSPAPPAVSAPVTRSVGVVNCGAPNVPERRRRSR